jgi:hypothetical protein
VQLGHQELEPVADGHPLHLRDAVLGQRPLDGLDDVLKGRVAVPEIALPALDLGCARFQDRREPDLRGDQRVRQTLVHPILPTP